MSAFAADANERRSATKEPSGFQGSVACCLIHSVGQARAEKVRFFVKFCVRLHTRSDGWQERSDLLSVVSASPACEGGGACKGNSWAIVFPSAFKAMLPHSASDLKVNGHSR